MKSTRSNALYITQPIKNQTKLILDFIQEPTLAPFYPTETTTKETSTKDYEEKEKTNEIPHDNDLLSAVKMASKKRVRSGYHSSTGPGDFMRKKYTSNLLSVCIQIYSFFFVET